MNGINHYWRSGTWPWRKHPDVYNYSFVYNEDETYFSYFIDDDSVIVRIVVESSGSLRRLTRHESHRQWKEFWSAPKYHCDLYNQCGSYSKCDPNNLSSFECTCLPGYKPRSPRDWSLRDGSGGCVRKRLERSFLCSNGEAFVKVPHVKLPDPAVSAYWISMNMSPADCENQCRENCSCTAYASLEIEGKGSGCIAWYGLLLDTMDFGQGGYDLYVRVDALELAELAMISGDQWKGRLIVLSMSVVFGWSVIILITYCWLKKRKRKARNKWNKRLFAPLRSLSCDKDVRAMEEPEGSRSPPALTFFTRSRISTATSNFSPENKIAQGGFGSVFELPDGQEITVKRWSKNSGQGAEEFRNEVMLIAKLQHRNLVILLGCCVEGKERILVNEHLPNNSLDLFLLDFGMARPFESNQVQGKTARVVGTYGYMSPEYAVFVKFSAESNVFIVGVIVLETISGKKSNSFSQEDSSLSLIGHVWELWRQDGAMEIIDSSMHDTHVPNETLRCIQVGLLCVQ